jgi:RNA polymerase sigma factor (sigma-70 family)
MGESDTARWPGEIARLASDATSHQDDEARNRLWMLLYSALELYLRLHASRQGWVDRADIHDLAAEKSLELIQKLDSQTWNVQDSSAGEIKAFLSTVARNSLVDLLRRSGRHEPLPDPDALEVRPSHDRETVMPDGDVERSQFTQALEQCVGLLKPKWRTMWFFRVFYELPSKVIARHPEVQLKPSHVDVVLQRCRGQMRECMRRRGFDVSDLPPGSYAALWEACRAAASVASPPDAHE